MEPAEPWQTRSTSTAPGVGASGPSAPTDAAGVTPGEAFSGAIHHLSEIREFVSHYLAAKGDALKLMATQAVIYGVLGVVGVAVACAIVATAGVLLLLGLAHAVGALLWHTTWAGELIVACGVFAFIAIAVVVGLKALTNTTRKALRTKYENRLRAQRNNFGRDVESVAATAGSGRSTGNSN